MVQVCRIRHYGLRNGFKLKKADLSWLACWLERSPALALGSHTIGGLGQPACTCGPKRPRLTKKTFAHKEETGKT